MLGIIERNTVNPLTPLTRGVRWEVPIIPSTVPVEAGSQKIPKIAQTIPNAESQKEPLKMKGM